MEKEREEEKKENFINEEMRIEKEKGEILIMDEMIKGFRWNMRGEKKIYGIVKEI